MWIILANLVQFTVFVLSFLQATQKDLVLNFLGNSLKFFNKIPKKNKFLVTDFKLWQKKGFKAPNFALPSFILQYDMVMYLSAFFGQKKLHGLDLDGGIQNFREMCGRSRLIYLTTLADGFVWGTKFSVAFEFFAKYLQ